MRVLVVDDYPGAADIACVLTRLLGHDATSAKTGLEAIEAATSVQPDVVILDLGLPDIHGYEVARRLRAPGDKRPFIAALTGGGDVEHRIGSLAAGINLHVMKPASAAKLTMIFEAAQRELRGA
jgi:DNA-binding response OmpR family regulator